jgi:hypothetical protein
VTEQLESDKHRRCNPKLKYFGKERKLYLLLEDKIGEIEANTHVCIFLFLFSSIHIYTLYIHVTKVPIKVEIENQ